MGRNPEDIKRGQPGNAGQFANDASRRSELFVEDIEDVSTKDPSELGAADSEQTELDSAAEERTLEDIEWDIEDLKDSIDSANNPGSQVTNAEYKQMLTRRRNLENEYYALEQQSRLQETSVRNFCNYNVSDEVEEQFSRLANAFILDSESDRSRAELQRLFGKVINAASGESKGIPVRVDVYGLEQDNVQAKEDMAAARKTAHEARQDPDGLRHVTAQCEREQQKAEERAKEAEAAWRKGEVDAHMYKVHRRVLPEADRGTHEAICDVSRWFQPQYRDAVYADIANVVKQHWKDNAR